MSLNPNSVWGCYNGTRHQCQQFTQEKKRKKKLHTVMSKSSKARNTQRWPQRYRQKFHSSPEVNMLWLHMSWQKMQQITMIITSWLIQSSETEHWIIRGPALSDKKVSYNGKYFNTCIMERIRRKVKGYCLVCRGVARKGSAWWWAG